MAEPRTAAANLVRDLRDALGDRLRSAWLYGSVARDEYIDGLSNVNVLVLLDDIDPILLERAAPLAHRWASDGLALLLMEMDEWARAADVFAIELLDMADAHEVLHGPQSPEASNVSMHSLRLQAEREIRGKLILLHGGMLRAAEDPAAVGDLLMVALPSFLTFFRAALRLQGKPVPVPDADLIRQAAALIGFDASGFQAAFEARRSRKKWKVAMRDDIVARYNTAAEQTATFVDRITG
jgi:predicted nucleotidyltransferase